MKYESTWGPIQKGAHGVIFVCDPGSPSSVGDELNKWVNLFPRAMSMQPKFCMVYVNYHNAQDGNMAKVTLPANLEYLNKEYGSAEDNSFIYSGFEKYLVKLLKLMSEQN